MTFPDTALACQCERYLNTARGDELPSSDSAWLQRKLALPLFHLAFWIKPLKLRITAQNGEVRIAACPG